MSSALVARLRSAGCVFAEDEARLLVAEAATPADLEAMVERRVGGLPLEQVLGWAEFRGLRIAVEPGVFVPRRRTELLAERAVALVHEGAVVADLCCGAGAIGAALEAELERIDLHAVDVDPAAVRCARRNLRGRVYEGDLYDPLPPSLRGSVDLVVANAPYVPAGELGLMPREARLHEARVALDGGADGLDVVRRVIAQAPAWLASGGSVLVETSRRQAPSAAESAEHAGLRATVATDDDLDVAVVIGTRCAGSSTA